MTEKVLLTGRPGCGKTTLIKCVVNNLPGRAGGFYTEEIRDGGTRAGFKIVTLDGEEVVFAHVCLQTPEHVGKYGLDLSVLETVGVEAVREAVRRRRLVVNRRNRSDGNPLGDFSGSSKRSTRKRSPSTRHNLCATSTVYRRD